MGRLSKRFREMVKLIDTNKMYLVNDAVAILKQCPPVKFNQSVEIGTEEESPLRISISETTEIKLSFRDNVFSFEFAALDFSDPEKNQY